MSGELPNILDDLPASARIIVDELLDGDPRTGKELRDATGLPRRTIYSALCRLRELGVLHERASLQDTRQRYLWLDVQEMYGMHPGAVGHPTHVTGQIAVATHSS